MLKIGIIGAGSRGIGCFGKLVTGRDDAEVTALADPNSARMEAAARMLGRKMNFYTSVEEMLKNEHLDGVVITSPDYTHQENALLAIKYGVHVLVDKPLATTAAGCERIIRAARKKNLEVSVGFNLRHAPVLMKIKDLIDSGAIGNLMLIENREFYDGGRTYMSRWNRKYEWSGGLWVHKGSHDFDIFNWWNSSGTPVRVSAFAGVNALRPEGIPFDIDEDKPVGPICSRCAYKKACPDAVPEAARGSLFGAEAVEVDGYVRDKCLFLSDKDTHDNGVAIVEYDNNVRASHIECFICNFTDRRYTIIGDRGIITASLETPKSVTLSPRWGDEDHIIHVPPAPEGGHGGADPGLVARFIECLKTGNLSSSTGRDGIRSVAVGEAAEKSWREHRMVEISELADLNDPVLQSI
jgi:predicted dehydrogenase